MYEFYLADGQHFAAQEITLEPAIVAQVPDNTALFAMLGAMTPANLASLEVYKDGQRVFGYTDCELINTQMIHNYDGSMVCHFYLGGYPENTISQDYKTALDIITGGFEG